MPFRLFVRALVFGGLALAAGSSALAQDLKAGQENRAYSQRVLGELPGHNPVSACFVRRYDATHLAQHPKQKVTQMLLLLKAHEVVDDGGAGYAFVIGITQRGKKGLYDSGGSCGHVRAEGEGPVTHLRCGVDCDGGGVDIEMAKGDKSLLVRLESGISINRPGTNQDPDEGMEERETLIPGADDKVFRLDRVSIEECARLFPNKKAFREFLTSK